MPNFQTIADPASLVDYMVNDYWPDQGAPNYRPPMSAGNVITVNLTGLDARSAEAARLALEAWEMVADLDFREVTRGGTIAFTDDGDDAATVIRFTASRQVSAIEVNIGAGWLDDYGSDVGSYGFRTYVHEIGHALGLGHTGDYNNQEIDWSRAQDPLDSYQYTIMSYFGQDENPNTGASRASPITAQLADILAIQRIYGAPGDEVSAGDTVWGRNSTLDNYLGGYFRDTYQLGQSPDHAATLTIRDVGGHDLLDFSHHGADQEVNLVAGGISSVLGLRGNVILTGGTLIEDYNAGHGDDRINGNAVANRIDAGGGADTVWGNGGDDSLSGGVGDDLLRGGAGNEQLFGGYAHDSLLGEAGRDQLWGGLGEDRLSGGAGGDRLWGEEGADRLDGGSGGDDLDGGLQDDRLSGGSGRDSLTGAAGGDLLDGGSGDDRLSGGEGVDILRGGAGRDRLDGGEGGDTLTGGGGADVFVFDGGRDTVTDFARGDRILLDPDLWGGTAPTRAAVMADLADTAAGLELVVAGLGRLVLDGVHDRGLFADSFGFL